MEIIHLKCNNCGADLEINDQITFFNCTFCNSSLALKKTGNVAYTEVIGEIKTNTEKILGNTQTMLHEKEIARLDREWEIEREKYRISGKDGGEIPDKTTGISTILGAVIALIFVIFWFGLGSSMGGFNGGPTAFFMFFGIGIIVITLVSTFSNLSKTQNYHDAEKRYKKRREKLLEELNSKK